ncbi:MAG: hypothetical protein HFE63_00400 [Clostridiales bacterium]|nr:hypothetical protein [Clostridiales bacterium]
MKRLIKLTAVLTVLLLTMFGIVACKSDSDDIRLMFDSPPGLYTTRFTLSVSCSDPSLELHYTLDSSLPTPESKLYSDEDGIPIAYRGGGMNDPSSVNIVRCAAFNADGDQVGDTITGTYILADDPNLRYSTIIVSIVCEPDDLYGYERGILVPGKVRDDFIKNRPSYWTNDSLQDANFFRSGIEWERPAHVEFYTQSGELMLEQNVGIRVSGGWNRNNAHKSLRLFARYTYDDHNVMSFDAFPGLVSTTGVPVTDFKTLILRTGSNNMWNTTIQTQFMMELADGLGIDTMRARPICVYINGKYYGYMTLFEDYSTTYFETNYNISSDEICCINGSGKISGGRDWELDNGPTSERLEFMRMINYITSLDMREEKYYKKASEMLDFDSFIKYMCFEGYIANSDWPQNNVRVWRRYTDGYNPDSEEYGYDGRWRFLLKDLDLTASYSDDSVTDSIFKRLNSDDGGLRLNAVFKSLFKNADFKNRVYCFLCDLLSTTMEADNVMSILGEVQAGALIEMRYYTKSYGLSGGSNDKWHEHVRSIPQFFISRYDSVYNELPKKYDSVWGNISVEIEGAGKLNISSLTLESNTELEYLVGLNIPVSAEPERGWKLKELTANGKSVDDKFMMSSKKLTLRVVFEPDDSYVEPSYGLVINELKYNHSRSDESPDLVEIYNASSEPIYLKGYMLVKEGLRDDGSEDKDEWNFPAVTIGAGDYMVIACDKRGTRKGQSDYHASFGIGIGDTLTLIDRRGNTVDKAELINCNNFAVLARDLTLDEWYYEPYGSFGEANIRAEGYELSSVIDPRLRDTFIVNGKTVSNFAKYENGKYIVTEKMLRELISAKKIEDVKEQLNKVKAAGGYDLDKALDIIGYKRYYIPSLNSNVIY